MEHASPSADIAGTPRVLVVLASFGNRNLPYLKQIVDEYRAMPFPIDIVVVSDAVKNLDSSVDVVVGLPSSNPWSLPFAHKPVFAARQAHYDLFVYSEDDIRVTEANIRAFLGAVAILRANELPGFLRYELDADGRRWMPDAHGVFHWQSESVCMRGGCLFGCYTNEHAACYMMTRGQLESAIASGGFLVPPHEGRYDMLCAAATDPYTRCNFQKLVCLSSLEAFLVHHMSNKYAGRTGLPLEVFNEQVEVMKRIAEGRHPATTLCEVETRLARTEYCKSFYEVPDAELIRLVPDGARDALSIGCGWGATEAALERRGIRVTALPLDSVIGASASKAGIATVYGRLDECLSILSGRSFDCVLVPNLLHLQRDPEGMFRRCAEFVRPNGVLVVDCPNFERVPVLAKRLFGCSELNKLRRFEESGVSPLNPSRLKHWAKKAGMKMTALRWRNHELPRVPSAVAVRAGRLTATNWLFRAGRSSSPVNGVVRAADTASPAGVNGRSLPVPPS